MSAWPLRIPQIPAVYALYGGGGRSPYVAYVGVADRLRQRIIQHLINRDSSVATGTSAVGLNPEYVNEIWWWEHPKFAERDYLEAAELVAFDALNPALRSRGGITDRAKEMFAGDKFQNEMRKLFSGEPSGRIVLPRLEEALERIAELEDRVAKLEKRMPK